MPRPRRWTDDDLAAAVAASATLREVCEKLGIETGHAAYRSLRAAIRRARLDASHLPRVEPRRPRRPWTDDDLRRIVGESQSVAEVLRGLGYKVSGGMHRFVTAHIRALELDTSHFTGQAWNRGGPGLRKNEYRCPISL